MILTEKKKKKVAKSKAHLIFNLFRCDHPQYPFPCLYPYICIQYTFIRTYTYSIHVSVCVHVHVSGSLYMPRDMTLHLSASHSVLLYLYVYFVFVFFSLFHSICIFCVYFYEKTALHQCLSKMEVKYIISQCDRWQCDSWGSLWLTGPLCPWTMVPMDGIAHVQALCSIHNLSTHGHTSPLCPWMVIQDCPLYTGLVLRANHSIDWPMMAHWQILFSTDLTQATRFSLL